MTPRRACFAALTLFTMLQLRCGGAPGGGDSVDSDQFREPVFLCEEALARLQRCCPQFDASRVVCKYYYDSHDSGCSGKPSTTNEQDPALGPDESHCILSTACGDLAASGVCTRAQDATPRSPGTTEAPACP